MKLTRIILAILISVSASAAKQAFADGEKEIYPAIDGRVFVKAPKLFRNQQGAFKEPLFTHDGGKAFILSAKYHHYQKQFGRLCSTAIVAQRGLFAYWSDDYGIFRPKKSGANYVLHSFYSDTANPNGKFGNALPTKVNVRVDMVICDYVRMTQHQ